MTDALPDVLRGAPTYEQVRELEAAISALPPAEIEYEHHFSDGVYTRVMHAPAGTVMVGKIHRHSTVNILAKGAIKATSEDGTVRVLEAPCVFVSPPGCKKVGLALTDITWINVHATKLTDLAAIEAKFIVPEPRARIVEENA